MSQDQQRAALDDLINRHGLCATKDGDLYRSHLVRWMLKAYEAALESPEVTDLASALRALLDALPSATTHPAIQKARAALAAMEKQK